MASLARNTGLLQVCCHFRVHLQFKAMLCSWLMSPVLLSQLITGAYWRGSYLHSPMPTWTHLVDLDGEKCRWICFLARNSEGCQARILVLGLDIVGCPVPEQSPLMLSAGREQAAGLGHATLDVLSLKQTFELFQIELFPSLLHQYKNSSFLISLNLAVFLVCKVNKKSSQFFGSLGNFAVQENQTKHLNALKLVRQQSDFLGT